MDVNQVSSTDVWRESQWIVGSQVHFQSIRWNNSQIPRLSLSYPANPVSNWVRYLMASAFLMLGMGLYQWKGRGELVAKAMDCPHLVLAAIGGFWWLFLSPFWLGPVVLLLAMISWTWNRYRIFKFAVRRG